MLMFILFCTGLYYYLSLLILFGGGSRGLLAFSLSALLLCPPHHVAALACPNGGQLLLSPSVTSGSLTVHRKPMCMARASKCAHLNLLLNALANILLHINFLRYIVLDILSNFRHVFCEGSQFCQRVEPKVSAYRLCLVVSYSIEHLEGNRHGLLFREINAADARTEALGGPLGSCACSFAGHEVPGDSLGLVGVFL